MEATAIQVDASNTQEKKVESKTTKDKALGSKAAGDKDFFSLLKNLGSALERENFLKTNGKKPTLEKTEEKKQAPHGLSKSKKAVKKSADKKSAKEPKTALKVKADEVVNPKTFLGVQADGNKFIIKEAAAQKKAVSAKTENPQDKTLLQKLLEATQLQTIDDGAVKELLETAEKANVKTGKADLKASLASLRVQQNVQKNAAADTEKRGQTAADELAKKFTVKDLRTKKKSVQAEPLQDVGTHTTAGERVSTESSKMPEVDINLNAKPYEMMETPAKLSAENKTGASEASSFTQLLTEQIYQNTNEIVQAGKIVLMNDDAGIIRLNLQPESLGKVKIVLQLHEGKKLSGKITVNSKEALSAFEKNLSELTASFEKNGFETSGFELSWSNGQNETGERFATGQKVFGFSSDYEEIPVMLDENSAESIRDYSQVDVLA